MLKICGGALLCVVSILLIKSTKSEVWPLQWAGTLLLCGAALLMLHPILSYLGALCEAAGLGEVSSLLFRGLGVAFLTQIASELCRQCGEAALASGVELAGKAEILLLCLPQLQILVETAGGLLAGI